ncbi:MAG: nuclease [Bacteriovoracaceae bacterium]|nr:nuclease [Bacteriovoracaceae bacterium]
MKTKISILFVLLCISTIAYSNTNQNDYYSESFLDKINDENQSPEELKKELFILSETRQTLSLSYEEARRIMFGNLFLETRGTNQYVVKDVYCNNQIDQKAGAGPNNIPNPQLINCEHTWPQSKFSKDFPSNNQKTDLHHLFPTDMKANSTRGNNPFAEVNGQATNSNCTDSKIGNSLDNNVRSFEPPIEHRGNVARAMYYFSTRYKMSIDYSQAKYLKKWNAEDPVDSEELNRNEKIMNIQGNRNPFVDHPELIDRL